MPNACNIVSVDAIAEPVIDRPDSTLPITAEFVSVIATEPGPVAVASPVKAVM